MTYQTRIRRSLGGSPAGASITRWSTLTLAAILCVSGAAAGNAQEQPHAAKAAQPAAQKPAAPADGKVMGGYSVHSMVELGGRFAEKDGSRPMWATMVNQTTGARVLSQSIEMHTLNPSKTPFFDTLSSSSFGYGGDPNDVSMLKLTKGRWYDFTGMFRRDRNYFDYDLLANSLLTSATAATPVLVSEPDSLHLFNTVRRNTDTLLTLFPVSLVSFRAGFNHNTNEGPTYSTIHYAGDVQVAEWFRSAIDTYVAGADVKLAPRTTVSYDEFLVFYRGDNMFHLAPTPLTLSNGTPVSLGVDVLQGPTITCGTKGKPSFGPEVVGTVVNPFCSGTTAASSTTPIRTSFPTEQLRFSSHYWDRASFNGRLLYSGDTTNVNRFNQTFTGYNTRTGFLQEIETGGLGNGRLADNKRSNTNGDFGMVAELNKYLSISDAFNFWNQRNSGYSVMNTQTWIAPSGGSMLTPVSSVPACTPGTGSCPASPAANTYFLNQKIESNTLLAEVAPIPEVKLSGGWRFVNRNIVDPGDDLTWHRNWLLLGGVVQPSPMVRFTVNYDMMRSKSADPTTTPSDTYTREAPSNIEHLRARVMVKPSKWINFAIAGNDYMAENNDPQVNHKEHNHDISFATQIIPSESIGFDFSYAHDDVYSVTDLCYVFTATANAAVPAGAVAGAGTCANTTLTTPPYLGNGYYDAPTNFFTGDINYSPSKYFRVNAGARLNSVNGSAEFLNPYQVPGALQSKIVAPFADLVVNIAPQWSWHGNWNHRAYEESGPAGPAPRSFHGDIYTLGVKYAF